MTMFGLLTIFFAFLFWLLRVVISFTASMEIEFALKPLNNTVELILCFVSFICIILIYRRKMWAAVIYLISYWGYFGVYIYDILKHAEEIVLPDYLNILTSVVGIILPFLLLADLGLNQSGKKTTLKTKKTDWFYQNEEFDRKFDDRADRNQYKF